MRVMNGSIEYPMSQRVQDTIKVHGLVWACDYYMRHGFEAWEFFILAGKQRLARLPQH